VVLTLQELVERRPLIHNDRTITWGIRPRLAKFLDAHIGPGSVTLETGAGLSTLVILRKQPRRHIAIQPVADEFAVILEFAEQHGIDTRNFLPVLARSQDWLSRGELPDLDLALVDGAHALPVPFIDWHYAAERLKVGGLMVVDDTHLVTGAILADFMEADPGWEEVMRDGLNHFAIYRKRAQHGPEEEGTPPPSWLDVSARERVSNEAPMALTTTSSTFQPSGVTSCPTPSPSNWLARSRVPLAPPGPPPTPPFESSSHRLPMVEIRGWEEYQRYRAAMAAEHRRREAVERSLVDFEAERFTVDGYCAMCERAVGFNVSFAYSYQRDAEGRPLPNWREQLQCECGFGNRMRAAAQIIRQEIRPRPDARIYLTERVTGLYEWLKGRYPGLVGSEYLGGRVPLGAALDDIRNEDLTALTFDDRSFDLILSFDVMEHVPDSDRALRECFRCLDSGGSLVFSAPFRLDRHENLVRARVRPDGTIDHRLPPEYHENPVDPDQGALCFRDFGWEVLEQMKAIGFSDPRALVYWSRELGYLGGDQVLLVASRPAT
jgi:SAM-dependent methyltransferase